MTSLNRREPHAKPFHCGACALLLILFLVLLLAPAAPAMEAGAAKTEITPPLGTPLNGYFDRLGRGAMSVHDPVWVRALYVDDGETRLFLVNADLCAINRELRERVLELAPDVVPEENIILTATHTHSAQGGMIKPLLFRSVSGRFMPEILEMTAQRFADTMTAAYNARKRATIGYGTASQEVLSRNRRHEGGPIDTQIGVIRVDDSDGIPIAIVGNFAAHPTSVGGDDQFAVSADYVGYYYNELERLSDPSCVAMFLNGALGNQTCAAPEETVGWARTEAVGRLLAIRVKEVANGIACEPAKVRLGYATPELPPTVADWLMPSSTILHTLEIGDLLVCFFPGEPCVELGLELRRRALERGYDAQFSVGLADDYLLYSVPTEFYSHLHYEACMNFYGPRMAEWFYGEFSKLMARGEPESGRARPEAVAAEACGPGQLVRVGGSAYGIGYQRGAVFGQAIREAYQAKVIQPCEDGRMIPETGLWELAPPFMDTTPLALTRLAVGARPLLAGLPADVFEEIEGIADGAELPFDAAWLLQCAPTFAARSQVEELYRSPFCTMFAAVGDRAGADDLLVGRNLDWVDDEAAVVIEVAPEEGHAFAHVGFAWNAGVFTGMNDVGIVVCAERVEALGEPSLDGPPVELVLRGLLQQADSLETALAVLAEATHLRGYHVLVADPAVSAAQVVELGMVQTIREPVRGLLLGVDPESENADAAATKRYGRAALLLEEERILSVAEIKEALSDVEPRVEGAGRVFNEHTRHSVVFEPNRLLVHVAFRTADGGVSAYETVSIKEGARHE